MVALPQKDEAARFWCSALLALAESIAKEKNRREVEETCVTVVREKIAQSPGTVPGIFGVFESLAQSPELTGRRETLARDKSWREVEEACIGAVRRKFSQEAKNIAEAQKMFADKEAKDNAETRRMFAGNKAEKDESSTKVLEAFESLAQSALTGWKFEMQDTAGDRIVLHQVGSCPIWEAAKDLAIQDKLHVYRICQSGCAVLVQAIKPNPAINIGKSICRGDEYCEISITTMPEYNGP
ncbi:MAG TPA: hypothetical protein VED00_02940 [archaeon]|nr:hypothetical protein [archaeon]